MSSINCACDEYNYGRIFPGVGLSVYKNVTPNGYYCENGDELKEGAIGFLFSNNAEPFLIINLPIILNPWGDWEYGKLKHHEQEEFNEIRYSQDLWNDLVIGHAVHMFTLVDGACTKGYSNTYPFGRWLAQYTAKYIIEANNNNKFEIYTKNS